MSSSSYESTTHRVLGIPEIVEMIFTFMDDVDNARNACVCRRWSDIALNHLWRELYGLHQLFRLLGPLRAVEKPCGPLIESFDRTIDADDWKRLNPYARRVRKLVHCEQLHSEQPHPHLAATLFDEVARTRTSMDILPHLQSLEWYVNSAERMRLSVMFMHENIKHFAVWLRWSDIYPLSAFFKDVVARMPYITELDLRFLCPVRDIQDELLELIRGLPELQRIILPVYSLTSSIIEGLSKLQHLGVIQFEYINQGNGDPDDLQYFAPRLEEGSFPALYDLSLSLHLSDMTRLLKSNFAPTNLTSLYVHALTASDQATVVEFFAVVAENCKMLTHLYLDAMVLIGKMDLPLTPQTDERLTFDALRPLLSCTKLKTFDLRWPTLVHLSQENVEEIAVSWPDIEVLVLNSEPIPHPHADPPTLTLRALLPLAQHCPKLTELGFHMDASTADLDVWDMSPTPSAQPFKALKKLYVGLSAIHEAGPVALFLSQLCPLGAALVPGVSFHDYMRVPSHMQPDQLTVVTTFDQDMSRLYERWAEVGRMMPLLTSLRMRERERTRALEREMEDLRTRCKVLEERARLGLGPEAGACIAL
ncbi:hypothetical protein OBBRIDRAFT_796441 [Obba rivulosa]|uniref:F-box domain-containing protein n=1 Tax=Obba rivulosa TaxID=1052685 RepID=A0A8E2DHP0_9APHY|nr:hypothetical protein OBBRIDRAFT_796441 [Obba rivulosa]